jgi:hypothetical protein
LPGTPKTSWTEADLNELIGQPESIRREFKSGRIFDDSEDRWIEKISLEVSALANTEGGELFLGINEDKKSKPRVATSVDGAPVTLAPERLQNLIEGNVSPYLPGIRVRRVLLPKNPNKVAFVVQIPQGSTAYQAKDGRYYGRSEFGVNYLRDHDVRLRMNRGSIARGIVLARLVGVELGPARQSQKRSELETRRAETLRARNTLGTNEEGPQYEIERRKDGNSALVEFDPVKELEKDLKSLSAQIPPDMISFDFVFRNDGELTIRAPLIEFRLVSNTRLFDEGLARVHKSIPTRLQLEKSIIYPGDEQTIDKSRFSLECKREAALEVGDYALHWKVFLDNSPPSYGEIDLGTLIETARQQSVDIADHLEAERFGPV